MDRLCDSDDTSYPLLNKRAELNMAGESLVAEIINADGTYQWDDTNYTDTPRGTGTLVEGQESYSFASDYLAIEAVDILDTGGVYRRIPALDHNDLGGLSPEEYFGSTTSTTKTGFPVFYDLFADDSFRLYPAPTSTNVTLTNGFRVWFKRTFKILNDTTISNDYTVVPGIPTPFHYLLSLMVALPYCLTYKKDRVALLEKRIDEEKKKLLKHYARREKDRRKVMTMNPISFR